MYKSTFEYGEFTVYAQCSDVNEYQETEGLRLRFYGDDGSEVEGNEDLAIEVEDLANEYLYEEKYESEIRFT